MGTPADTIDVKEAAKMLKVTMTMINKYVRRGLLTPCAFSKKRGRSFYVHDVAALAEASARRTSSPEVALIARQARALSTSNARRINELCRVLGLDTPALEVSEEAVVALYLQVEELKLLEEREKVRENANKVIELARSFYAIDEAYLALVVTFTSNEEPWDPFLTAAQRLCEEAPRGLFTYNKELAHAYGYLEASRRQLRHVAFFFERKKNSRTAQQRFGMGEDYTAPIIQLLFPH